MTWHEESSCRDSDTHMFYAPDPEEFEGSRAAAQWRFARDQRYNQAKEVCSTCSVVTQCLLMGMQETEGIWGGTTPTERMRMQGRRVSFLSPTRDTPAISQRERYDRANARKREHRTAKKEGREVELSRYRTEDENEELRTLFLRMRAEGFIYDEIAEATGYGKTQISRIITGKTYYALASWEEDQYEKVRELLLVEQFSYAEISEKSGHTLYTVKCIRASMVKAGLLKPRERIPGQLSTWNEPKYQEIRDLLLEGRTEHYIRLRVSWSKQTISRIAKTMKARGLL